MLDRVSVRVLEREVALNHERAAVTSDDPNGALKCVFHA